jgi:phosphoglycolate phosphatase
MKTDWFFFDLDGTLADSLPGLEASIVEALSSRGRTLGVADVRPYIGPGIRTILKKLHPDLTDNDLDGMERCFRASYDVTGVRNTLLFEGVLSTLQGLRQRGAELFVVTNKPKLATGNLMEMYAMNALFREVLSRNSREPAYASKGEMLRELVARHSVDCERAVMVGDTAEDMHAAEEAGMRFAFVEYGYGEIAADAECVRLARIHDLPAACGCGNEDVSIEGRSHE